MLADSNKIWKLKIHLINKVFHKESWQFFLSPPIISFNYIIFHFTVVDVPLALVT
jgi:hypothetical protein